MLENGWITAIVLGSALLVLVLFLLIWYFYFKRRVASQSIVFNQIDQFPTVMVKPKSQEPPLPLPLPDWTATNTHTTRHSRNSLIEFIEYRAPDSKLSNISEGVEIEDAGSDSDADTETQARLTNPLTNPLTNSERWDSLVNRLDQERRELETKELMTDRI
jgi:hypothetical protein